ncbi:hypothetical protein GCM10009724_09110 [Microbacterium lacticum]|nr:hypothetical protein MLA01_06590 [Microbacterium lacticum]GGN17533.1 hypothetical protein GCM10009724_09110 [Microbacterium lacticum]
MLGATQGADEGGAAEDEGVLLIEGQALPPRCGLRGGLRGEELVDQFGVCGEEGGDVGLTHAGELFESHTARRSRKRPRGQRPP